MLVAVSGGVDSMVLLKMFINSNMKFEVLHINHNTRGEEHKKDLQCIENLIREKKIKLHVFDYQHNGGNFQQEARKFRLKKAKEVIEKRKLKCVVYAHHKDDQIENILMNKEKICSKLMEEKVKIDDVLIYRPLLNIYKKSLIEYAKKKKIPYNEDISNSENKYKRNYYRNEVISEMSLKKKEYIYNREIKYKELFKIVPSMEMLDREVIKNAPLSYSKIAIYKMVKQQYPLINLKCKVVEEIVSQVKNNKLTEVCIGENTYIVLSYKTIYIYSKDRKIETEKELVYGLNEFNGYNFINYKYKGKIRIKQDNDKIKIKDGRKKVSRLFIDKKLDKNLREIWPIIVNEENEIIWIPNYWRKNEIKR